MAVWLIRCGDGGKEEHRDKFLTENRVTVGYGLTHPVTDFLTIEDLKNSADMRIRSNLVRDVGKLWRFAGLGTDPDDRLNTGDLVLTPYTDDAGRRVFAVGEVVSEYDFQDVGDAHPHTRSVRWHNMDIPRDGLPAALRRFLGLPTGFARSLQFGETELRQFLGNRNASA